MAGRASVRSTLATFLAPPAVTNVGQVFTSFPKRINFEVNATAGQLSRCAIVIFIESERENRLAIGGATSGWKRVDYTIVLQVFHHSVQPNSEDAMADFDIVIDALKTKLRSDHTFGDSTGTLVWQGAEPVINVSYGEPLSSNGNATETWAAVRFDVTQMIKA